MTVVVAKFGGTSMADATTIRLVANILRADPNRKVAVVSAPGCSREYQVKVTDLLLQGEVAVVARRFHEMMTALNLDTSPLPRMVAWVVERAAPEARVAFGEYMSAYILAKYLGWRFVDAKRVLTIAGTECKVDISLLRSYLDRGERIVVPGFYGAARDGGIELFSRGGSDITGALLASALEASLYENWTDVDGVFTANPRQYLDAKLIPHLTYREMWQHGLTGAAVYHADAVPPVAATGVPVRIRNTFNPAAVGTLVS